MCNNLGETVCLQTKSVPYSFFKICISLITGENKQQHRTKYVDMIISQLAQSNIRFLFSTGQAESALLVSTLAKKESKKGHSLPKCLNLPMLSEKYLPFYLSLPGIYISL